MRERLTIVAAIAMVAAMAIVGACTDSARPLPEAPEKLPCVEAVDAANDIYVAVFPELDNPSCTVDADCVVVDAHLTCENFEHRQRPFAVHVSEREKAEALLEERDVLCGRSAPVCRLERTCYEDVRAVSAGCSDAGFCVVGSEGSCT